ARNRAGEMAYTPVELRHVRVPRTLLGYKQSVVQHLLAEIADSFETVGCERHALADHVAAHERETADLRQRENVLTQALVAAEQAATEVREQARREADLSGSEARSEARAITRSAQGERARLQAEARRIEALLQAALGMLEEAEESGDDPQEAGEEGGGPQLRQVSVGVDWRAGAGPARGSRAVRVR